MCVIYACATKLPSEDELRSGASKNSDGAGLAWIEKKSKSLVHWKKGLKDEKAVLEYIEEEKIPFPLAIHFRTASVGPKSMLLTHPFPVGKGAPMWLEGTAGEVLFHNGHLAKWDDLVLQAGLASEEDFPEGIWSDTRALAWLVHLKGPGIIRFINETSRVLLMHAAPAWESEKPEEAPWAHFSYWGNWVGKQEDGFIQSITTTWANKGGVRVWDGMGWGSDDEDAPSTPSTPSLPVVRQDPKNIWTLEELQALLKSMEQELADARRVARG
jgi:hypothetical protein